MGAARGRFVSREAASNRARHTCCALKARRLSRACRRAYERVGALHCDKVAPTLSRPLRGLRQGVAYLSLNAQDAPPLALYCADLSPTALRAAGPSVAQLFALRSKRGVHPEPVEGPVSGGLPLRSKRFAVSALEVIVETRLRRPCLDRFAVFAKASRTFIENAK